MEHYFKPKSCFDDSYNVFHIPYANIIDKNGKIIFNDHLDRIKGNLI